MTSRPVFDTIELHLVRVFHTVISERSVSRAAMHLSSTQPVVSAQLKRLRALIGDPLLVRAGSGMVPTEVALQLMEPAETLLRSAEQLFGGKSGSRAFTPGAAEIEFRIAASDYIDPLFLPALVTRLRQEAPRARVTIHALSAEFDYRAKLARGEVDLVIGNWLEPPAELHIGRLFSDEIVCLVGAAPTSGRPRTIWSPTTSPRPPCTPAATASSTNTSTASACAGTSSCAARISRWCRRCWRSRRWC